MSPKSISRIANKSNYVTLEYIQNCKYIKLCHLKVHLELQIYEVMSLGVYLELQVYKFIHIGEYLELFFKK